MSEIQTGENYKEITGPTDDYYKFLTEKRKREQKGLDVNTLLSQELALVKDNVVIADLNLLRAEGTFSEEEKCIPKNQARYEQVLSIQRLESDGMYSLEGTNWESIDTFILQYFLDKHGDEEHFDINSIKSLDPAVAATLAYEVTKHFMDYDSEMEQNPASDKAVDANTKTADQLLSEKNGICRHFTKVSIAIYNRLKQIDESGSLIDTVLLPVHNSLMDDLPGPHAYCLLIAKRTECVLSIGDPTFFKTVDREVHSDLRLASLVNTLIEKNLLSALDIKEETLLTLIDEEISRLDKWIDFDKKFTTQKARQNEDLSNIDAIKEQGFDERAAHFFKETASTLQIVYALNTAKAMIQNPKYGGIVSQQQMERGSQAMFDWVIEKGDKLPPQATISGINKVLDTAPLGTITLELLTSIISLLSELNIQLEKMFIDKLQNRLTQLKSETISVFNDDIWAEPQREKKYSDEEIALVQQKINDLPLDAT